MSDLPIFVGLVALAVVAGIAVGMIVAGRIDRLQVSRPPERPDDHPTSGEDHPTSREDHE